MNGRKDDDERMAEMKKTYEEQDMKPEQLEVMRERIAQAKRGRRKQHRMRTIRQWSAVAAAMLLFVALPNTSPTVAHAMENIPFLGRLVSVVTFRDYQYEDERNYADVEVPMLVAEDMGRAVEEAADAGAPAEADLTAEDAIPAADPTAEQLNRTTDEINQEIAEITERLMEEFEEGLKQREGYQSMAVNSRVLATTEDYFALKLTCYQAAGSGAEWNYYYTIDLNTGERIQLADLFREGADYITPISENIKTQMQEQMQADPGKAYWLNDPEVPEWNFTQITEDTSFYLNAQGHIVICFDEGQVAPMYMGCPEFTIPPTLIQSLLIHQ